MTTIQEIKEWAIAEGKVAQIINEAAGFQFVRKTHEGAFIHFQYDLNSGEYRFYKGIDGWSKAVLYRIKRG